VELPENTVAIVFHVPAETGTITKKELHHALAQVAAEKGRKSVPKPGGDGYGKLEEAAIGDRLDVAWVKGQAAEMGIGVTRRQVSRALVRLRREAFKNMAQYHRFLKEAHYTRRDVLERVELQLLSSAIEERVVRGVSGEASTQEAFSKFVTAYEKRWRSRTICAPQFAIDRCSNGPPASNGSRPAAFSATRRER
jgi:hypothetical protein